MPSRWQPYWVKWHGSNGELPQPELSQQSIRSKHRRTYTIMLYDSGTGGKSPPKPRPCTIASHRRSVTVVACGKVLPPKGVMRALRHLTPRYIVDRIAVDLWQRRHPDAPWLTSMAVGILGGWLDGGDTVFEWGSGKSTTWFAEHAGHVVSVEHDPSWYAIVGDRLERSPQATLERYLVETTEGATDSTRNDYVAVIDLTDDETVDVVLVDGLHRDECALRAVRKVRPGGLLVIDNADWYFRTGTRTPASRRLRTIWSASWAQFDSSVSTWRRIVTTNGVWDTVFWIKPPSAGIPPPPATAR